MPQHISTEQLSPFLEIPDHLLKPASLLTVGVQLNQYQVQLVVEPLAPQRALLQFLLTSLCMPCGQQTHTPLLMRAEQERVVPIQALQQQRFMGQHLQHQQTHTHVVVSPLLAGVMEPPRTQPPVHTPLQVQSLLAMSHSLQRGPPSLTQLRFTTQTLALATAAMEALHQQHKLVAELLQWLSVQTR
jgi:hypothetical protein